MKKNDDSMSFFRLLKAILSGGRSEIERMEKENPECSIEKAKMYLKEAEEAWANTKFPPGTEIKM